MAENFGDMLNSQLQNNPEAWRQWQAEKRGQKIKMSRKKIVQLVENAIQRYRVFPQTKDKCMLQTIRGIEDMNWAREKQINLEIDYAWEYYKDSLFFQKLFEQLGSSLEPRTPLLLEEPITHKHARESCMNWMNIIHARIDASMGGFGTLIPDSLEDDSPSPKVQK